MGELDVVGFSQELIGVCAGRHVAAKRGPRAPFMSLSSRTVVHLAERMTSS
jgi:hypothetical protein